MKCTLLPADIDESLIFALLGRYHINGKKNWAPYEQAGFLYRRFHKHNVPPQTLAKEAGSSVKEVNRLIEVYGFMEDHGENTIDRWSYYYEYLRSNTIRKARLKHAELDTTTTVRTRSGESGGDRESGRFKRSSTHNLLNPESAGQIHQQYR